MKRSAPATEAEIDCLLEGFEEKKHGSSAALQRLLKDDPGGLALALALRITGDPEGRRCAAILLGEAFRQSSELVPSGGGDVARGAHWLRADLGPAMLEAMSAAASEPSARRATAEVVATAAFRQFCQGRSWPELTAALARCGCRGEMAMALEILEVLRDEAEDAAKLPETCSPVTWVYAQLAALQEESGALQKLLAASLMDTAAEDSLLDAGARVYCLCASGEVPELRQMAQDLAPCLAEAVARDPREAPLQALALAAADEVTAMAVLKDGSLPAVLSRAAMDGTAAVRMAAVKGLLQLLEALDASAGSGSLCDEEAQELLTHCVASISAILAQLPSDEATDKWAEVVDGNEEEVGDDFEELFQESLEDASRLIQRSHEARSHWRLAAEQLLQSQVWQGRHGGLLLMLRVAAASEEEADDAAASAACAALSFMGDGHPRVRWASLEVWARMLAQHILPMELIEEALPKLLVACSDIYARVRHRGLLVLLCLAAANPAAVAEHSGDIRQALEPLARSEDADVRQACFQISEHLGGKLAAHWKQEVHTAEAKDIDWPLDWK